MANTVINKNEDSTVTFETEIYLYDSENNKYEKATLVVPKASYDNDGTLFQVVMSK